MSDKSIAERLQVKKGRRIAVIGAVAILDRAIGMTKQRVDVTEADVVLAFAANKTALETALASLLRSAKAGAILWVAYPKLTSKLAADLSRDWSALRLKRMG